MDVLAPTAEFAPKVGSSVAPLRILVHDYAGHAYAVQLSRALAARGHHVKHVYCASNPMPQGPLKPRGCDAPTLEIEPIHLRERIQKGKFFKRRRSEIEHGLRLGNVVEAFKPDVVISGSAALDTQNHLWKVCARLGIPAVFWLQDLTGVATLAVLKRKLPWVGSLIGSYYIRMEERLLRESAGVVAITRDFSSVLGAMGVRVEAVHVIENWGPIAEIPVTPKLNAWSKQHGLDGTYNFIYSGTLGMKHNPQLLAALAEEFAHDPSVRVVAVTEGIGRKWLEREKQERCLDNLVLFDFQPHSAVPQVLGSADTLVVLLEPEAGVYSVPSKTLACLCAGRPLLLAIPKENLAARMVREADAGLLADPRDEREFVALASSIRSDATLRERLGRNARVFAEREFDVESVAAKFESMFQECVAKPQEARHL